MFSGSDIATYINIGILVYFIIAAGTELLFGLKRGWKRQLVHIGFTIVAILGAFLITELVISGITMDDENRRTYGVNFEEALPYYIERLKNKKVGD